LAASAHVSLKIYDVTGRLIRTLIEGKQGAGHHAVNWDGKSINGRSISSGIYFYCLTSKGFSQTYKMLILK